MTPPPPDDTPAARLSGRARLPALVAAGVAVLLLAGWALFYLHIESLRATTLARARSTAQAQARLLREHAEQALSAVSISFRALDETPDRPGIQLRRDARARQALLAQIRDNSPLIDSIAVVDRDGRATARAGSDPPMPEAMLASRHFRSHRDAPSRDILIGLPSEDDRAGPPAFLASRRLEDETGRFFGVIAARIRLEPFESLYQSAGADHVALVQADGTPLVSTATADGTAPAADGETRALAAALPSTEEGAFHARRNGALTDAIVGFSRSSQFPVAVIVGFDTAKLLADWRERRATLAAIAALSTLAMMALTFLLVRRMRRDQRDAEALLAAREAADDARIRAEAADHAKSEFLAHMSHELRTPLNAIVGFAELMSSEMFGPMRNPRYLEYAGIVHNSGRHLLAIINNILDLAKVDAGKWRVEPEPLVLAEVAGDLQSMTRGRADTHKVTLTIDVPADLPVIVTDRRLLLQILVNLTTNAIKFTPAGGRVRVEARAEGNAMIIAVADTGCGMTAEDIVRVLKPFGQGSSSLARKHHDTGLGLPLSARFAELLGGGLKIESEIDRGTTATIRLPLAPPPARPA